MSQLGLTPPSDLWDIFEFQTFLKNADPTPLTILGHFWISDNSYKSNIAKTLSYNWNWDIFEFGTFLKNVAPPLWPNWDIFKFQTFLIKVILQNNCNILNILSKVIFHPRSSSVKGPLPSKVLFHQKSSSVKGRLLSNVIFFFGFKSWVWHSSA